MQLSKNQETNDYSWETQTQLISLPQQKSRITQNKIRNLVSSNGDMLQTEDDIKKEITCFYKQLLRSAANHLPVINPEIMKEGQFLNRDMQLMLIEPVTRQEIV